MGRKRETAIARLYQNPKSISFKEADAILRGLGCTKRMKGSHATYTYPGQYPITIPFQKPNILPIYVKLIIQLIESIEDEEENHK